jgi:hypothetical protein
MRAGQIRAVKMSEHQLFRYPPASAEVALLSNSFNKKPLLVT